MAAPRYDNIFANTTARRPGFVEVEMDAVNIVVTDKGQPAYIATRRLGACSGVVILGRTAAIMAHIAPRSSIASGAVSTSVEHFVDLLRACERLYVSHHEHFPLNATAWGFFVAGFPTVTNDLVNVATTRFNAIGLRNGHTYYRLHTAPGRRDEVRACVHLSGWRCTTFFIEQDTVDQVNFSPPLPNRNAAREICALHERNYLLYSDRLSRSVQMVYGTQVEFNWSELSGIYDVLHHNQENEAVWKKFDCDSQTWLNLLAADLGRCGYDVSRVGSTEHFRCALNNQEARIPFAGTKDAIQIFVCGEWHRAELVGGAIYVTVNVEGAARRIQLKPEIDFVAE